MMKDCILLCEDKEYHVRELAKYIGVVPSTLQKAIHRAFLRGHETFYMLGYPITVKTWPKETPLIPKEKESGFVRKMGNLILHYDSKSRLIRTSCTPQPEI